MGSQHPHGAGSGGFRISGRALAWLIAALLPLLAATVVGMVQLWPSGTPTAALDVSTLGTAAQDAHAATVTSTTAVECEGSSADRLADGSIPDTALCASAEISIDSGPDQGQSVTVQIPAQVYRSGIGPGDSIQVARYPADALEGADTSTSDLGTLDDGTVYAWIDFSRTLPLGILAAVFVVLVMLVGRLRGFAAVAGLALTYVTVVKFMLPAVRLGESPVAVALVGSIAVMTLVLYLAHGISAKTTTALLGTIFGLTLTAGLAYWATTAGHLNGLSSEENYILAQITGESDLSGVILCGIIVAGLGVLNDVTITQASAVWEVRSHAPDLSFGRLFASGMRVGRDHLASTVYTIAFAYAGAALPTLILIDLYQQPLLQVLTSGQIAEEIARTLVGAIGLILAIPLTTALAAAVVSSARPRQPAGGNQVEVEYGPESGRHADLVPYEPAAGRDLGNSGMRQGDRASDPRADQTGWAGQVRPAIGPGDGRGPRGWQPGVGRAPGLEPDDRDAHDNRAAAGRTGRPTSAGYSDRDDRPDSPNGRPR